MYQSAISLTHTFSPPFILSPTILTISIQPDGGVKKGEKFVGTVLSQGVAATGISGGGSHSIPTGRWRDGICNFMANGWCHPMCCLACWCNPLALGQVATRMKLDAKGSPVPNDEEHRTKSWFNAFKVLALVSSGVGK